MPPTLLAKHLAAAFKQDAIISSEMYFNAHWTSNFKVCDVLYIM